MFTLYPAKVSRTAPGHYIGLNRPREPLSPLAQKKLQRDTVHTTATNPQQR